MGWPPFTFVRNFYAATFLALERNLTQPWSGKAAFGHSSPYAKQACHPGSFHFGLGVGATVHYRCLCDYRLWLLLSALGVNNTLTFKHYVTAFFLCG